MKSIKFLVIFLIVGVVLLGTLSAAIAAVTQPVEFAPRDAVLIVENGLVEVKRAGESQWSTVEDEVSVGTGDSVRTGEGGFASINAFDQGELRLDENTEIVFDNLFWNELDPDVFNGSVTLKTGRLWSRLLDFLSPDSSYEVNTNSTSATVRGTAFMITTGGGEDDSVYVDESTVAVRPITKNAENYQRLVTEGRKVRVTKLEEQGQLLVVPSQRYTQSEQKWILQNRERDEVFVKRAWENFQREVKESRLIDPDSPMYEFLSFAEGMRIAFTFNDDRKQKLKEGFARGYIYDAKLSDSKFRRKILQKALSLEEDEIQNRFSHQELFDHLDVRYDFRYTERITIIKTKTEEGTLDIEEVIEELELRIETERTDDQILPPIVDPIDEPIEKPIEEPVNEPVDEPVVETLPSVELFVTSDRGKIFGGEAVTLRAYLVHPDDTVQDISAFVTWRVNDGSIGYLDSNSFIAYYDVSGTVSVVGTYAKEGLSAVTPVTVFLVSAPQDPEPVEDPVNDPITSF